MADSETTVLFVDVSGSTRLYESVGDAVAHQAIDACIQALRDCTVGHGGRVVKTIGDEVMSVFASADAAAAASVQMQEAIGEMAPVGGIPIGVRIGLHSGAVVERDGDVFGDTVNVAARLTGLAAKGQVLTSRDTVERLSQAHRTATRRLYTIPLKGKAQEITLFEILWREAEDETALATNRSIASHRTGALRLRYLDRELVLDARMPSISLDRDRHADLPVIDPMASRSHARIEYRLGKFVLSDHSANSTYVTIDGEPEIVVRREELVLRGQGVIAFGQTRESAAEVAAFRCE